jgi:hypothetical protein
MRPKSFRWLTASLAALVSLLAFAVEARAQCLTPKDKPFPVDIEDAKTHMAAGVSFMQDPEGARYEEAYPEFRTAYELSGSLNALQNLAICAQKLELDGEAVACFKRFLDKKGADISPEDKAQVENDLRALEAAVAQVTFTTDASGTVKLEDTRTPRRGAPVRNVYSIGGKPLKLGIHPGEHKFVASVDGKSIEWSTVIKNGDQVEHDFQFEKGKPVTAEGTKPEDFQKPDPDKPVEDDKPKPAEGGSKTGGYTAGAAVLGIAGAAAIGWIASGAIALSKGSQYKKDNVCTDSNNCPAANADLAGQQKSIKTLNTVADVMMGVTLAAAVTGVVLLVVRPGATYVQTEKVKEDAKNRRPRFGRDFMIAPWAAPAAEGAKGGSGGAVLTATF